MIVVFSTISAKEALIERLGISDAIAAKRVAPRPGELVGAVVARGDAAIGVQQISELLPVSDIQILGLLHCRHVVQYVVANCRSAT
jgi:molybdate transport system substrate-binding protein